MKEYKKVVSFWQQEEIKTRSKLEQMLDNFRIIFAYNSGKIENSSVAYHDTHEIFENGKVLNFTGDPRTIFELYNQKVCYEFLADKIVAKTPLTIELVKDIHFLLTQGTFDEVRFIKNGERPGQFKKHDYVVGRHNVGEPPEMIPELIQELLDEVQESEGDPFKIAAYFHAKFEYYHPFSDGNGRVGRTLMNYLLMVNGYPPVIIYDEDKKLYYEALEAYDGLEEIKPLALFLEYEMVKTWERKLNG
jgi:Fic family protein